MDFKQITSITVLTTAAMLAAAPTHAAIDVTSGAFVYNQDFNSLSATSSSSVVWSNNSTLQGWSLFNSNKTAISTYLADAGSITQGAFRSYGDRSDRALGGLASGHIYFGSPSAGTVAGWIAVAFKNTSANAFTGFNIGFDGEQWRNGGNTKDQTMVMEFGFGDSFASVTTWSAPGDKFNFKSPVVGSSGQALNGNEIGKTSGLGGKVNTAWAANDTLWVRWIENNDTGSDHGLAIDNVSLSVISPVPEPSSYALMLAGLVGVVARRRKKN